MKHLWVLWKGIINEFSRDNGPGLLFLDYRHKANPTQLLNFEMSMTT